MVPAPCFAAERTLGKLATWLRLLGFDVLRESDLPKNAFPAKIGGARIVLTRTRRLAAAPGRIVILEANDPAAQLRELIRLKWIESYAIRPFTRCLRCNAAIEAIPREAARESVPDYVWETQSAFSRCPACLRVYWRGSHTQRSLKRIEALFSSESGGLPE